MESRCSPGCTKDVIKEPIKIISGWHHMHYLGKYLISHIKTLWFVSVWYCLVFNRSDLLLIKQSVTFQV